MVRFTPPEREKKRNPIFPSHKTAYRYLGSVDFDGDVVALRRPLGGFGHLETGADQVDAELSLAGDTGHECPFVHSFNVCVSPTCGHLDAL